VTLVLSGSALALINPDFTPVQLVKDADTVVVVTARAAPEGEGLRLTRGDVLKGEWGHETLTAQPAGPDLMDRLAGQVFDTKAERTGLLFVSRTKGKDGRVEESAHFSLGNAWYMLVREGEAWWLEEGGGGVDLVAVWEGRTDMLIACARYIVKARRPEVPVTAGVGWAGAERIGAVSFPGADEAKEAEAADLLILPLAGGRDAALVCSPSGDRAFARDPKTGTFADITEALGLESASRRGALGDFNADGRPDLVSWDGKAVRLVPGTALGKFAAPGAAVTVEECLALTALPSPEGAAGACLVSTSTWPVRILFAKDGTGRIEPLGGGGEAFPGSDLKQVHACVVADFDGDARADIVEPFRTGALFYKGTAAGFEAPKKQSDLFGGFGTMHPEVADLDADGRLDVILLGKAGVAAWRNAGEGRFESLRPTGEPDRFVRTGSTGGAVGDFNSDGRQDFVIFYGRGDTQAYFSRGFATFGYAKALDLAGRDLVLGSAEGQRAGCLHDWNRDGAPDLLLVLKSGPAWVVWQGKGSTPPLAAEMHLPPAAWAAGPVRVVAEIPDRSLGAWNLAPGHAPAWLTRERPGPIRVEVFRPGGAEKETLRVIVEGGLARRELP
jgi:hypothetical protein